VTFYWSDIEPAENKWQFPVYDGLVQRATQAQIPLLGILAYSMKRVSQAAADMPGDPWALSYCPPDELEEFAAFAATVTARYPQVNYWEIWNEPNNTYFWRPAPDPALYGELLRRSYGAIKAVNSKAMIAIGGLSPGVGNDQVNEMSAPSFLQGVYQSGGKNYFEAVAFHPYNDGVSPDQYLQDYVNSLHNVMTQNGDQNKEIWVTELGWHVGAQPSGVTEAEQADYLSRASKILYSLDFVNRFYWYNLKEYSNPAMPVATKPAVGCAPAILNPSLYGLYDFAGSPRPAADAFKKAVQSSIGGRASPR